MIQSRHDQSRSHQEAAKSCRCHQGARGNIAYLFGSTARNEANADSDIDLFLDYDPRGRFSALDLVAAKRLLEERLGVAVDLTTRKGLHPLIRKKIEAEATQVFRWPRAAPCCVSTICSKVSGASRRLSPENDPRFRALMGAALCG